MPVVTERVRKGDLLSAKALLSGFHARKPACPSSKLVRTAVVAAVKVWSVTLGGGGDQGSDWVGGVGCMWGERDWGCGWAHGGGNCELSGEVRIKQAATCTHV